MSYVRLDLDTSKCDNRQLWAIIESMLDHAESLGPKVRIRQYDNGEDSIIVNLFGTDVQVRAITAIVNSENGVPQFENLVVESHGQDDGDDVDNE